MYRVSAAWITALLLAGCAAPRIRHARSPMVPRYSFADRGVFHGDSYFVPQEREGAEAAVALADSTGEEVARVSADFAAKLRAFGEGRLADGRCVRLLQAAEDRMVVRVQPSAEYGVTPDGFCRVPYRTVAVDPHRILPGSVIFLPEAYGLLLPTGEIHDGFFLADDVRPFAKDDRIGFFVGGSQSEDIFRRAGLTGSRPLHLYLVSEPHYSAVRRRFADRAEQLRPKPLFRMVAAEIDQLIRQTNQTLRDVNRRLVYYAERARGTPYLIFLLGEGPEAPYDADPLMDFARVDCMTFCEQMLAMAISSGYRQMFHRLQRIRYRDGIIGFTTRNHYTLADWLPNNRWLLRDATEEIGGKWVKRMTKVIDRRAFFLDNGVPEEELQEVPPPDTLTVAYVPREHLLDVKPNLRGGEIISIVSSLPGIFSAHMGIIVRDRYGNVIFRHGSSSKKNQKVVDELWEDLAAALKRSKTRVGVAFMRIRDDWRFPEASNDE